MANEISESLRRKVAVALIDIEQYAVEKLKHRGDLRAGDIIAVEVKVEIIIDEEDIPDA